MLGCTDCSDAPCDKHIHLQPDQLVREVAESLETPLRVAVLDDEVLTFDVAEIA